MYLNIYYFHGFVENIAVQWLKLMFHIWEKAGSNLGMSRIPTSNFIHTYIYIYIYIIYIITVNQISSRSLCYASFSIHYLPTVLSFEASDTRVRHSTIINKYPNILSVSFANRTSFSTSRFSQ